MNFAKFQGIPSVAASEYIRYKISAFTILFELITQYEFTFYLNDDFIVKFYTEDMYIINIIVIITVTYYHNYYPANIHLFKVNNINTRKRCEICSKLTIKTPERRH